MIPLAIVDGFDSLEVIDPRLSWNAFSLLFLMSYCAIPAQNRGMMGVYILHESVCDSRLNKRMGTETVKFSWSRQYNNRGMNALYIDKAHLLRIFGTILP